MASNFYRDPWAQYRHLSASDFPAFGFNMEKWIHCVNSTRGERPGHDRLTQQLGQRDRADSYASPSHPKNVFTLVVALKRMQLAGGVLGEHPPCLSEGVATWPNTIRTVRYGSDQVAWDHETILGLADQYFPFAVNTTDYFSPEIVSILRSARKLSKQQVRSMTQFQTKYKTNNMIIHYGIDADRHYDQVMKMMPSNYTDMYYLYK